MDCMRDGFEHGKVLGGRFHTVAPLNHGSFGMVFSAIDQLTDDDVAVKCITRPGTIDADTTCPAAIATDECSEELAIHSRLALHPNIVNLIHHFESEAHQYMVLELCSNGDLYEAIRLGRGPLETEHVRDLMLQLVDAVDHMHSNGVYHRDIKPENIFLTSSGIMKLGDFGLATTETWSTEFAVGSDRYMAPEQFDSSVYGYGYSPAAADVWAIGIVLLNVLFQRNPFAIPTISDPLFADFARNRHSLFDVFPNLSQDTFEILVHSLSLDPANRSLAAVREGLCNAVCFTTDDESLDDFCTEQNELVPVATAAREPLRTPSISSPGFTGESFPWTTALLKTPQKTERQLSTIPDEQELFPGSVQSSGWQYVDADEASLSSNIDSGLGMSYKSSKSNASKPSRSSVNFVGSLPISFARPSRKVSSPYGGNGDGFSKSWSDLWDEDAAAAEEEAENDDDEDMMVATGYSTTELGLGIDRADTAKPSTPQPVSASEDDRGSATPRPTFAQPSIVDRSASPLRRLIEHDRANPESPKQRSASILDKWAALGNFRRARQEAAVTTTSSTTTPTPQKTRYYDAFASFAPFVNSTKRQRSQSKLRESNNTWRQVSPVRNRSTSISNNRNWERRDTKDQSPTGQRHSQEQPQAWSLDNNWRKHRAKPNAISTATAASIPLPPSTPSRIPAGLAQSHSGMDSILFDKSRLLGTNFLISELAGTTTTGITTNNDDDDIGDLEWVGGGWH